MGEAQRRVMGRFERGLSPFEIATARGTLAGTMSMSAFIEPRPGYFIDPEDPRRAERFELYVGPMELANAFGELTDPVEQRARFLAEQEERRTLGRPVYPIDEGLLRDLPEIGPAAGIALGLDRLLMLCLGLPAIQSTLVLPPEDAP